MTSAFFDFYSASISPEPPASFGKSFAAMPAAVARFAPSWHILPRASATAAVFPRGAAAP